jgi:hypothetical protein
MNPAPRQLAALTFALILAATCSALIVAAPVDAQPPTPTITPTPGATPTPSNRAEPTEWWAYLPALLKSTLLTPPTLSPTAPATNTQEPPPRWTETPTSGPSETPATTATASSTNTPLPSSTVEPTTEPTPPATDLRIFTMQCDGRDEFVRILNDGPAAVNLFGWSIFSVIGAERFTFPSYNLEPGDTVSVHSGPDAPPSGGSIFRWTTDFIWVGTGDAAQLKDPAGTVVDSQGC